MDEVLTQRLCRVIRFLFELFPMGRAAVIVYRRRAHSRRANSGKGRVEVFKYHAIRWLNAELFRAGEKNIGEGFIAVDAVGIDDCGKVAAYAIAGKNFFSGGGER
jgi:hypothetical protein